MPIQILSPQAGAIFKTTQNITLSGNDGPAGTVEIDPAVPPGQNGPDVPGTEWTKIISPITTPGDHTIWVHGPGGRAASVKITVQAAGQAENTGVGNA